MPTVEFLTEKLKEIKEAVSFEFKDEDVDRIVEEKNRFRAHPTNYAMRKTILMKERDAAQLRGEDEVARDLNTQIQELEERANELDKRRSSSISLISYINNRNRRRNVEEAEKAIMEEARANRGLKIEDPFTRRSTKPRMSFKPTDKEEEGMAPPPLPPPSSGKKKDEEKKNGAGSMTENNLYSLHDFEIELDVPLPGRWIIVKRPNTIYKIAFYRCSLDQCECGTEARGGTSRIWPSTIVEPGGLQEEAGPNLKAVVNCVREILIYVLINKNIISIKFDFMETVMTGGRRFDRS